VRGANGDIYTILIILTRRKTLKKLKISNFYENVYIKKIHGILIIIKYTE